VGAVETLVSYEARLRTARLDPQNLVLLQGAGVLGRSDGSWRHGVNADIPSILH